MNKHYPKDIDHLVYDTPMSIMCPKWWKRPDDGGCKTDCPICSGVYRVMIPWADLGLAAMCWDDYEEVKGK